MDSNITDCDPAERDRGVCNCTGGTLSVLRDVQRAYEERLEMLDRMPASKRLQMQVDLLRSWVGDVVAQNTLLARAVEDLESEATARLLLEKRKHGEMVCELRAEAAVLRRRLARKDSDLRGLIEVLRRLREFDYCTLDGIHFFERDKRSTCGKVNELKMLNESLHKENYSKDREIRKLSKDAQQYEQTILNLRNEISLTKYHTPDVSKKDAEVMAGMCCTGAECGDWEPVKDFSAGLREEMRSYQERIQKMEANLKCSGDDVRALRKVNVGLREELHSLRGVCAALGEQCRAAALRSQFKDEIIREMRAQLKRAKARSLCDDATTSTTDVRTSTPNVSRQLRDAGQSSDVSIIETSAPHPILITHDSIADLEQTLQRQCNECCSGMHLQQGGRECVLVQENEVVDTSGEVEELFFNEKAGKSTASQFGRQCVNERKRTYESKSATAVPATSTKIKRESRSESFNTAAPESFGRSSATESPSGSCASARAHYYQNKLLATLQILQNKEETVRVQADSLSVAEARIASLTARVNELKGEIERKGQELQSLRKALEDSKIEKTDVSITAQIQEMENQENIVTTLQNNLSVIEELYRECFYETAKQDNLIEMLRKSYLDVRLMDKEKSNHINKLQSVINTQKWSLNRCQDIAIEVDSLKMEITNFLNSSNNDSGVWEESIAGGVTEDLQDIAAQLLRLRDLLTGDCTCGMEEENTKLKQNSEVMEVVIGELRQKISVLENSLEGKDTLDKLYQEQIHTKEIELHNIREQLTALEQNSKEQSTTCDTLTLQLQQSQVSLNDKSSELANIQKQCEAYEDTIRNMTEELSKAEQIVKENWTLRAEVCARSRRAARLQRSTRALEVELTRMKAHCERVDASCREKARTAMELESQLDEAHERGAALCGEARRVVRAVRGWAARMREINREQEDLIKDKESQLRLLQQRLEQRRSDILPKRVSETDQCCMTCPSNTTLRAEEGQRYATPSSTSEMDATCSKCLTQRNETVASASCSSSKVRERWEIGPGTSASEMGSCSSTPVPPQRSKKKTPQCNDRWCSWWGFPTAATRDASAQRPLRRDAAADTSRDAPRRCVRCVVARDPVRVDAVHSRVEVFPPELSPNEEMLSRVESMSEALADGYRRWTRNRRSDAR